MLSIKQFKTFIHKNSFKLLDVFLKEKKLIKTFPRYKLKKSNHNSLVGWVPYIKGNTKIQLFNFFSVNYSIRKPIEAVLYLINKNEIISFYEFTLYQEELIELDLKKIFDDKSGEIIIMELRSTLFKKNHGGHDGHFRFWGKYVDNKNNIMAITHSMPLSYNDLFLKISSINSRNYFPKTNDKQKLLNFFPGGYSETNTEKNSSVYGFNLLMENNIPKSIWHLSPTNTNKKVCKLLQGFYCPDNQKIDPIIVLDPNETGFQKNEVSFFLVKNKQIISTKNKTINGLFKEKVSSIFGKVEGNYYLFIQFQSLGGSHSHVHYSDGNSIFDQVHMHDTSWEVNNNELICKDLTKNKNCRKFF